jgi:cell wall-associated NlpC family hydrolase
MSIDAVLSRVDQIVAMRQALLDPAAAASTLASSGGSSLAAANGTAATSSGGASFASALASAQSTGSTTATVNGVNAADAPAAVQQMTQMADSLVGKPYVWGGGHSGWGPQSGYDCSGFVSAVLHAGGYLSQPADTTTMPQQAGIESGPGQYVTIYDRAQPGENGHVIIDVNGQFYESGGSAGTWGGGGGVEKINRPSDAYLATFPNVLHPAGL